MDNTNQNAPSAQNNSRDFDLSQLSKPISTGEQKKSSWDKLFGNIFGKKTNINIITKTGKEEEVFEEKEETNIPIEVQKKDEIKSDKNHSQLTNSDDAEEFFAITQNDKNKVNPKDFWNKLDEKKKSSTNTSVSWLIFGALSLVGAIVLIMASFGLFNMIKKSIQEQSMSTAQQQVSQAEQDYKNSNYLAAKKKIDDILLQYPNNSEAKVLLEQVNEKVSEQLMNGFIKYKEADLSLPATEFYQDPKNHFSVMRMPEWQTVESDFDIKFADQLATYGVKKFPKTKSIMDLQEKYMAYQTGKDNPILAKKENINFNDSNSTVVIIEEENYYEISLLMQKYYYGYELSGWLPKDDFLNSLETFKKFVKSFQLNGEYAINSYDNLTVFSNDNFEFYAWPNAINAQDQELIKNQFADSLKLINSTLQIDWNDRVKVYLYPSWDVYYQYTLANNSFSDYKTKEMHIIYLDQQNHQSFGYETTKLIFQNSFGEVKEPIVLEGVAVLLDQTGRDYLDLVRKNQFVSFNKLLNVDWQLVPGDVKYFQVGVFSKYLIEKYGVDLYVNLAKEKQFPEAYQKVYNKSLDMLEAEMKVDLQINT